VVLTVRDTGVGLSIGSNDTTTGTRFGLEQVRERLATLYGAQASLTLAAASDAEGGTIARIELPAPPGRNSPR
jgi:signal transduction histidine kinase